jgi:steroid delta-isomerase-like uncharacterized protein
MGVAEHKALAQRVFDDLMSQGDLSLIDEIFAPDVVAHDPGREMRGAAAIKQGFASLRVAFPDLRFTVEDMVAEGNKVAVRYTGQGTQHGEFWNTPPTGKSMRYTGILIWRFEEGKIAEHWAEPDLLSLLQQLGVIPAQPAPLSPP